MCQVVVLTLLILLAPLSAFADGVHVPITVEEALASPQAGFWKEAMDAEMASLWENGTWQLVEAPIGVQPIDVKWVFDLKRDSMGNIVRFKARLVARGFQQKEGIDFNDTFAPVSKYSTTRAVLAVATAEGWDIQQLDVKTAFLQGRLEEQVFVKQPPYYSDGSGRVCLLFKALYGLKQAPRAWHQHMHEKLVQLGYKVSVADPGLYVCERVEPSGQRVILLVYVDDMLLASPNAAAVQQAKEVLLGIFDARDVGSVGFFVGMNITRDLQQGTIKISNERMIVDLLQKFGMVDAHGRDVPMSSGAVLKREEGEPLDTRKYPYSTLVGSLLYLAVTVRPDISYSVGVLSKFMSCPTMSHWVAAKGVLRYLGHTRTVGITYGGSSGLFGWCDADFAKDLDTRKSTTGYVFTLSGGAISWASKRQPTVAASTTEAEYMAASAAVKEALWLRKLVADLGQPVAAVPVACDSQGALSLLHNPILSERSKHIDVHHHFVRERVQRGEVQFGWVPTMEMTADVLTKPLSVEMHWVCCGQMGVG